MIIYVASPFMVPSTKHNELLRQGFTEEDFDDLMRWRTEAVVHATAELQARAYLYKLPLWFYTPIGYEGMILDDIENTYGARSAAPLRNAGDYWLDLDKRILNVCDGFVVVDLPGYSLSTGVAIELELMEGLVGVDLAHLRYQLPPQIRVPTTIQRLNKFLALSDKEAHIPVYDNVVDLIAHYRKRKSKYA